MTLKSLLRGFTPPLLKSGVSRLLSRTTTYSGPYSSWALATSAATGYSDERIISRVEAATAMVLKGEMHYEQDGVAFAAPASSTPVLSGLLLGAALDAGRLSVLDFGGSLGSNYLKWRRFFDLLPSVQWEVVEQAVFVAAGRRIFRDTGLPLAFHSSAAEAGLMRPSVALFGSVLQYLEFPLEALAQVRDFGPKVLIIDRTPLSLDGKAHFLVQHVSPRIYPGSYALHAIARESLDGILGETYDLIEEYDDVAPPAKSGGVSAPFRGSIWLRKPVHDA